MLTKMARANTTIFKKPMIIMLSILGVIFSSIISYKLFMKHMIKKSLTNQQIPTVTVSAIKAKTEIWQQKIKTTGTLRAVKGVNVTTESSGQIRSVHFNPGSKVKKGDLLVLLNADSERAQLQSLQAEADLAKVNYERNKAQFAIKSISKSALDSSLADLKSKNAQVAQQISIIEKKKITAPFDGYLGISHVNPGQHLNPGDKIAALQSLDPIYVNFYVPQNMLSRIKDNQTITLFSDAYPGENFLGKITTIDPVVEINTRNILVEATISNGERKLLPGMYAQIEINEGIPKKFITIPQSAISYNSYGDFIFIVKKASNLQQRNYVAIQKLIKVGEKRNDQISILNGVKEGDIVIISGQHKLKNNTPVKINNTILKGKIS